MNLRSPPCSFDTYLASAGCDYLTVTAKSPPARAALWDAGSLIVDHQQDLGFDRGVFRGMGYVGWSSEGVQLGERDDTTLVRLSGDVAQLWWEYVYRRSEHVTRFDAQVTIAGAPRGLDVGLVARQSVEDRSRTVGRPFRWEHRQTDQHGSTLYLGSRTSQRFYRLYDKGYEERRDHLAGEWRYEAELKEETAETAAAMLVMLAEPARGVLNLVHSDFSKRGVAPLFDADGTPPDITPEWPATTDERTIGWLNTHVSGPVKRLVAHDRQMEVMRALALPGWTDTSSASTGKVASRT